MNALEIGNVGFLYPWVLVLIPIMWFILRYIKKKKAKPSGIFLPTIQSIIKVNSLRSKLIKYLPWLRYLALTFFLIALSGPQKVLKEEKITNEGIDIALAIDVSPSMLATDLDPNRLEATKKIAAEFVSKRLADRISVSVFAAEAFTFTPLTTDHKIVIDILKNLQSGQLEDGTAIGMGLASAINCLKSSKTKSKIIILLTDGVNNAGYIDPMTAAKLAEDMGIKVYTIGVGTKGQALAPITNSISGQVEFKYVQVEIDENLLVKIANLTKGQYFRATDSKSLEQIYNRIDELEKTKIEKTTIRKNIDYYYYFAFIGLFMFLIELFLKNTWLRTPILVE